MGECATINHTKTPEQFVANILADSLWHTTSRVRFNAIRTDGQIRVEPCIPDTERQKTRNGPANYPFVRFLGGVSLFDFTGFDPDSYGRKYPSSSWAYFVPVRLGCTESVWIEINRAAISARFIGGKALLDRQRVEAAHAHPLMPIIEAAHIGDLSENKFLRALLVRSLGNGFEIEPLTI